MLSGPKWIQDESDLQQQSLKEQLDNLETGWNDVHILWENRKKMLIQALNHQVNEQRKKNLFIITELGHRAKLTDTVTQLCVTSFSLNPSFCNFILSIFCLVTS